MAPVPSTKVLERIWHWVEKLSRIAVWVGGALMIASVFLICIDVVTRKFFELSTNGSNELSGYAFAISTSWALGFTMLQRVNVRVDVLYRLLPVRVTALLDWLAVVVMGIFVGYLSYYGVQVAQTSWVRDAAANTTLGTPLWIPQSLWAVGLLWMSVVLVLMLIRASVALVTGNIPLVKTLAGQRSSEEEAKEEAEAGERLVKGDAA
ncbi:MAG: TRAP transporter small permease subunit [Castellaniella sp.]|uniref:TRAP transporter small permease subunit n=1 Tax=Castellaniella sp. TaxID=1955812 RepID=UPI0011F8E685|nr:TRAP transporter small permease subunit [Castellaniella sp.]TAN30048.1 MAG: TRAP transporter small permease subunit [Castellaniella sp.]